MADGWFMTHTEHAALTERHAQLNAHLADLEHDREDLQAKLNCIRFEAGMLARRMIRDHDVIDMPTGWISMAQRIVSLCDE